MFLNSFIINVIQSFLSFLSPFYLSSLQIFDCFIMSLRSLSINSLDKLLNKKLLPVKAKAFTRAPSIRNPMLAIHTYILLGIIFCSMR